MSKIHVIGAGLSGMAAAYFCKKQLSNRVYLYDPGDKKGASFVGAGLLHPFVGPKALLSEKGMESMEVTALLLEVAKQAQQQDNREKIILGRGLYRLAMNEFQKNMLDRWCRRYGSYVEKVDSTTLDKQGTLKNVLGVYKIKEGRSINMELYLEGLKNAFLDS
ncbi:hypothetical protein COB21_01955, partial [Candidatus Aerophobetes bacterium]